MSIDPSPAFLRAGALARFLGLGRSHTYKYIVPRLTKYRGGGRVILYSTAEAFALIKGGLP
jgi:hypothetical protein